MNVLITGATGFLGHALVHNLSREDVVLTTIKRDHRYEESSPQLLDNIVCGDITDFDLVRRTIAQYEIEWIYHFASQAIVKVCADDPMSAYQTNVMGTVNILEAVRQVGDKVKSILVSTSDKVYGNAHPPYTESTPLQPRFTYEATKACQDVVSQNYFHNYGLPIKIVRCSNIYGPGDPNLSRLIPRTIRRVIDGESPIIYSDVQDFEREFVYIDDAINAFRLIQEKAHPGEIFCVGGTGHHKITHVVEMILAALESSIDIQIEEKTTRKFREIEKQWIDASKLRALGWEPRVSLEEGIARTVEHYNV